MMDLLGWAKAEIAAIGAAEFTRQLNAIAELMQVKPISLEAVMRWHRGEVRQLSGRSRDLVLSLHSQRQGLVAVTQAESLPQTEWFNLCRSYIMVATEEECIELLSLVSSRFKTLMTQRATAVSTLVRTEFLRQGLSVFEPQDVARFTNVAGSSWQERDYPRKLMRLLTGTLPDTEIEDIDFHLIAACLRSLSGNQMYTESYLRSVAGR